MSNEHNCPRCNAPFLYFTQINTRVFYCGSDAQIPSTACRYASQLQDRIKRLEEAGERLWVKARSISVEDTYDRHGNEVTVHELNPETVVLDYDHGDGITAGNMVELLEALKDWRKAKEAKL